jgi:hypothetical protein
VQLQPIVTPGGTAQTINFALALQREGWILGEPDAISLDRPDEAAAVLDQAFKLTDTLVHEDPQDESSRSRLFLAAAPLAEILRRSDAARGLAVYDHAIADMDSVPSRFLRLRSVNLLAGSAYALRSLGRPAEARRRLDRTFQILKELNLYPAPRIDIGAEAHRGLAALADHEADTGSLARGISVYRELLQLIAAGSARPESSLPSAVEMSTVYRSLAALLRRNGDAKEAAAVDAMRLQLWQNWSRKLPDNAFIARQRSLP